MAKINKQEVIQKLIDELNLYPGKDLIPSELADKILAVYQINAGEVSIKNPTANVVASGTKVNGGAGATIYTTPATGKFYLTNVQLQAIKTSAAAAHSSYITITPKNDTAKNICLVQGNQILVSNSAEMNFNNPIELEAATNIVFTNTTDDLACMGSIVGYTESA